VGTTPVEVEVDHFFGLSDRSEPFQLSPYECPDCLNVDWSDRFFKRRNGYSRLHTNVMRVASARFDGINDFLQIPHISAYALAGKYLWFSIVVQMNGRPTGDVTIISKGYGARSAATNQFRLGVPSDGRYRKPRGVGAQHLRHGAWSSSHLHDRRRRRRYLSSSACS